MQPWHEVLGELARGVPRERLWKSVKYTGNLVIHQARGVQPGPSRVSDSPVSAECIIYEASVLMGELICSFFSLLQREEKSKDMSICHPSSFLILPLSSRKALKEAPSHFPRKNKGFINFVFCINWAERNPFGTRLDFSSLVNKQVATGDER